MIIKKTKVMITPQYVAECFLKISDFEGDLLANYQIQTLLYYTQGYSLALNNKPLIEENLVLGENGPIFKSLYNLYKKYGVAPVPPNRKFCNWKFTKKQSDLINIIYNEYAQFSGWKLAQMVKNEPPILETKPGEIISKQLLKKHFLTKIKCSK